LAHIGVAFAGAGHAVSVGVYEHWPLEQEPVAAYSRRVIVLRHDGAGGVLHVMPVQGFGLHTALATLQPQVHVWSCGVYEQEPLLQVPVEE
jgi:hypothetical protein